MEICGQVADGWMPVYWPKSSYRKGLETVAKGSEMAGRPADAVECVASLTTVIDDDVARAKRQAAGPISWYVTNMGDFYHRMLTRNGFGEQVAAMRRAGEQFRPMPFQTNDQIMEAMGDNMLEETAIWGDLETVAMGIEERRQLGVDLPIVGMPAGDLKKVETTLGTLVS
jgi:alkanesulfonate monooxygenase SsuD/methylene tetrahydromethanopterin reductase-like flavin-dependent oxidoreductase (luciferase family)